jgi:hypothetical protein
MATPTPANPNKFPVAAETGFLQGNRFRGNP